MDESKTLNQYLCQAYFSEISAAINYLSIFNNCSGLKREYLASIFKDEAAEEFGHAAKIADRMKIKGFTVPGLSEFNLATQGASQTGSMMTTNAILSYLIVDEMEVIKIYKSIIDLTKDTDPGTADLATQLLIDEEEHLSKLQHLIGD